MTKNFTSLFSKILISMAIVALVLIQVGAVSVSAQSQTPPAVASYEKLPVKGQLIIPAGKGFVAPEQWQNLNVTLWYGVKTDTVASMGNLGNGLANDRAKKYGGVASDYPTVTWAGPSVNVTGGNCREQFYSDAAVLTAGVVYGDECPILVEYNAENQPAIVAPAATDVFTATPTPTVAMTSTPTAPAEAFVTPSAQPSPTATQNPDVILQKDLTVTNNGLQWFLILALLGLMLFLAFRRPSAPVETVASKATTTRRKTAPKKKSTKK